MSAIAQKAKSLYDKGALKASAVEAMFEAGKITQEERDWILGVE